MLDTDALLRPIRADSPTGENLRDDSSPTSLYYQIKDARNAARSMERAAQQAEDPASAPTPDWQPVLELAPRVLNEASKDLEIAVWLIEALVRREGFAGLRRGFELVRRLLESYWEGLHPRPDEEGLATRVAPLVGLNGDEAEGTLIVPIGLVPLLEHDGMPLSAWHFRAARELAAVTDPEQRKRRLDAGVVPLEAAPQFVEIRTASSASYHAGDAVFSCADLSRGAGCRRAFSGHGSRQLLDKILIGQRRVLTQF